MPSSPSSPLPSGPSRLLARLDAIGRSLQADGRAVALIGLGSVGLETERLDAWSDLDFFVVAAPGQKGALIDDLSWLAAASPLRWSYRNTADGHKALGADGVFCEFAVFEAAELRSIPFAPGRVVWQQPGFDARLAAPVAAPHAPPPATDWLLGEVLGNLHVGLSRYLRGERLAAARMVQVFAVDRWLELVARVEAAAAAVRVDPFAPERRFEQRHPASAAVLPDLMPGYLHTPEAARNLLGWLQRHCEVNPAMAAAIEQLIAAALDLRGSGEVLLS